jgi:hyaluronoglucosaminidase
MLLYNRLQWLFDSSSALYPSLYLSKLGSSPEQHTQFAIGRMNEAVRVARRVQGPNKPTVNAYIRYLYHDVGEFLTQVRKAKSVEPRYMNPAMPLLLPRTSRMQACPYCYR